MTTPTVEVEWQRVDPRMLLVYPVRELMRFLPVLIGLFVAGTASGRTDWWHGLGVAIPMALGVLRYFTTYFRITETRVELRRGLLNRHHLATPLDRVRTVDVTASLTHRALGLTTVRIGTGTASKDDEDHLDLDGLPAGRARQLRSALLRLGVASADPASEHREVDRVVLRFDPAWVRFAPLTTTGLVLAGGALGVAAQAVNTFGGFDRLDPDQVVDSASGWSAALAVPLGLALLLLAVSALAIGGYVVTNWGFTLTHTGPERRGAWHLRRGLLTTRETTLDDDRVSGVTIAEPLGLRLVRGGRVSAIVTGLGGDSRQLAAGAARAAPGGRAGGGRGTRHLGAAHRPADRPRAAGPAPSVHPGAGPRRRGGGGRRRAGRPRAAPRLVAGRRPRAPGRGSAGPRPGDRTRSRAGRRPRGRPLGQPGPTS